MGTFYKAVCPCGYESETLTQGVGFSHMETKAHYQLAYCDHCGEVSSEDISGGHLSCSRCNGKLALYKIDPDKDQEKLLSMDWHCPNCKQNRLRFEFGGLWD